MARLARGRDLAPPADPALVDMIVVGDSYTYGWDDNDDDSYPTRLSEMAGIGIANQGVPGFGPLQAELRFEQIADRYPNARIAILGIMYEDIVRMVNSNRHILYSKASFFTFKPYMRIDGNQPEIVGNPNGPTPKSFVDVEKMIGKAFDDDYWARPDLKFPYFLSVTKTVKSHRFKDMTLSRKLSFLTSGEYAFPYADQKLLDGLALVIRRFVEAARGHGVQPVIVFIPRDQRDLESPAPFIRTMEDELGDSALFIDVGKAPIDWPHYRYTKNEACHPSPQGYKGIARAVYEGLKQRGRLPLQ